MKNDRKTQASAAKAASKTPAATLTSPATRAAARGAADAMLVADGGLPRKTTGVQPAPAKAVTTAKPGGSKPPAASKTVTVPQAAPQAHKPGDTVEKDGKTYAVIAGGHLVRVHTANDSGKRPGRQPRPRHDVGLRCAYLTASNVSNAPAGAVMLDFPDLWGGGVDKHMTVVVLTPASGSMQAYGVVCGPTGEDSTAKRCKAAVAFATAFKGMGPRDYLYADASPAWISLEPTMSAQEQKEAEKSGG